MRHERPLEVGLVDAHVPSVGPARSVGSLARIWRTAAVAVPVAARASLRLHDARPLRVIFVFMFQRESGADREIPTGGGAGCVPRAEEDV